VKPLGQVKRQQEAVTKQVEESIATLELKLNKSFLLLTQEIDQLKDPLADVLQDFEK